MSKPQDIYQDIRQIIERGRRQANRQVNLAMVQAYWLVGKRIVEEEQQGEVRATYGKALLKNLSFDLQKDFGKGFSVDNLEKMRGFYLQYPLIAKKSETVSRIFEVPDFQLSWSHYLFLLGVRNAEERAFYEIESRENKSIAQHRRIEKIIDQRR